MLADVSDEGQECIVLHPVVVIDKDSGVWGITIKV